MDQPFVLIVSDDPDFSRSLVGRWQSERSMPAFTLVRGDLCQDLDSGMFELAIAGALRPGAQRPVLDSLALAGKPVLLVCEEDQPVQELREIHPGLKVLRRQDAWIDAVVVVATEILRSGRLGARAERAEQAHRLLECHATLGRYMLEMRHTMNNALTSVLGNSELLLMEPGSLSAPARSQVETVRNMAVRMHEILQRFSSIEKELRAVEQQAEKEATIKSQAAAAGA